MIRKRRKKSIIPMAHRRRAADDPLPVFFKRNTAELPEGWRPPKRYCRGLEICAAIETCERAKAGPRETGALSGSAPSRLPEPLNWAAAEVVAAAVTAAAAVAVAVKVAVLAVAVLAVVVVKLALQAKKVPLPVSKELLL